MYKFLFVVFSFLNVNFAEGAEVLDPPLEVSTVYIKSEHRAEQLIPLQAADSDYTELHIENTGTHVLDIIHKTGLTHHQIADILNAEAERDYSNNSYFPFPESPEEVDARHTNWKRWFIRKTIASLLGSAEARASLTEAIEDRIDDRKNIYDSAPNAELGRRAKQFYVDQCNFAGIA
jgi:hypothetical protein